MWLFMYQLVPFTFMRLLFTFYLHVVLPYPPLFLGISLPLYSFFTFMPVTSQHLTITLAQ